MSSFLMPNMAWMARCPPSGSFNVSTRPAGATCHDTPNRSLSQPHWLSSPPSDSFSQ